MTEDINMAAKGAEVNTASESYSKGNESFVNEDYAQAVALYTAALQTEPLYTDALVARAHALIKTEKFEEAKRDADKAIDILRSESSGDGAGSPLAAKAFLRSGVASFHLGRYREARNCFVEGGRVQGGEAGLKQWMVWCDEKIKKFGDSAPGAKTTNKTDDAKSSTDTEAVKKVEEKLETAAAAAAEPSPANESQAMPVPKITHDWYQTETQVVIEIRIKKLAANMVKVMK